MRKIVGLVLLFVGGSAVAEEWGDTSYVNPPSSSVQVEEISHADDTSALESKALSEDSLANANEQSYAAQETNSGASVVSEDISKKQNDADSTERSTITNISTVRNTYGVETEEKPGLKLYAAPFAGITSAVGNTTADATPKYAAGAAVGLLISRNMMVEASYTYSEQNLSNPRYNTTQGILMGTGVANVFTLKSNAFDAGVKLFFLGRESRLRPFFGAGMGFTKSYLNYNQTYQQSLGNQAQYASDFVTNQIIGFGQVGAEFAITKAIVVSAAFKLDGVFSSSTSANDAIAAQTIDASKYAVGDSLSRTASYTVGAGLGIYF